MDSINVGIRFSEAFSVLRLCRLLEGGRTVVRLKC
jgi:hypothetical protein